MKQIAICPYCKSTFVQYRASRRERKFCQGACARAAHDEKMALCKKWIARGWTIAQLKPHFHIGTEMIAALRRDLGLPEPPRCWNKLWDDDYCREVQGMIDTAKATSKLPVIPEVAKKLGIGVHILRGRLQRYRDRMHAAGIDPHPPLSVPTPPAPKIERSFIWSDAECEAAMKRIQDLWHPGPKGAQNAYPVVAQEFGITKNALIGRIHRYKNKRRIVGPASAVCLRFAKGAPAAE